MLVKEENLAAEEVEHWLFFCLFRKWMLLVAAKRCSIAAFY
jgi:hypothetical protein